MRQVTPKLGARVIAKAHLIRKSAYEKPLGPAMKSWERHVISPVHGIYVGRRNKSNGMTTFDVVDGAEYRPMAYFEVWIVAYEDRREHLICLPTDVVIDKELCRENTCD